MLENFYKDKVISRKEYTHKHYNFIPFYCTMIVSKRIDKYGITYKTLEVTSIIHVKKLIKALNCWSDMCSDHQVIIDGKNLLNGYK